MPDVSMTAVDYLSISIFDESVAGISHEKRGNEQIFADIPKMEHLYAKMVTDSSCRKSLGKAARSVMEHDYSKGSVLWHCTEGKDRCGLLSAVLLLALGAEQSTIKEDYLLTNRVNAAKSERYYQMLLAASRTETEAGTFFSQKKNIWMRLFRPSMSNMALQTLFCKTGWIFRRS